MIEQKYPKNPILIVDDEQDILETYKMVLLYNGINNYILCQDSREAMGILAKNKVSMVSIDLMMPHITGKELLKMIKEEYADIPVIVITGSTRTETAIECMRNGAMDYLMKPVEDNKFIATVKMIIEMRALQEEVSQLSSQLMSRELKKPEMFEKIITRNKTMLSVFKYMEAIAETPKPVLIAGESGAGKEEIAHVIHNLSGRQGEFVSLNIGGLDDNMFSDTLFGHKKGAFTGADKPRKGLIERAAGGTIFLDEIGELEEQSQVKLLRLLQEREYYPLGADQVKTTNARVICATNAPLKKLIDEGTFRKDLYFRLITHQIQLPPLRDRKDDIPVLVEHFVEQASKTLGRNRLAIPKEMKPLLNTYSFPGNIRELQGMIFDAVSMTKGGVLSLVTLKDYINAHSKFASQDINNIQPESDEPISYTGDFPTLKEVEEFFIQEAMKIADNNMTLAANLLGVSPSTLSRRFKK